MSMELRYDKWFLPFSVPMGMGPKRSKVEIAGDTLHVSMGWGFKAAIPLANITSATLNDQFLLGAGVHGFRGEWLVNGSMKGIVKLEIDPRVPAKVCGFTTQLGTLLVSVTDPEALIAACTSRVA